MNKLGFARGRKDRASDIFNMGSILCEHQLQIAIVTTISIFKFQIAFVTTTNILENMSTTKIITVFGATGNQGSSVINTVLAHPEIANKYQLRGVTRNKDSVKSKALTLKGVEMVEVDLNDPSSIAAAVKGSYGVYINTDYWTLLNKDAEIEQGKNIFNSCKENGVQHVVLSTLPYVSKLSAGKFTGVAHFDSKAIVGEYAEAHKGNMIISYFLPAMYMENIKQAAQESNDIVNISFPFQDPDFPWPMISPSRDTGNYVVGLFEAGERANGVAVQGVSAWTTPTKVAEVLGRHLGKEVRFNSIEPEVYEQYLPGNIRDELSEMMQWIGESSYYGKGTEKEQGESDKWLVAPGELTTWESTLR